MTEATKQTEPQKSAQLIPARLKSNLQGYAYINYLATIEPEHTFEDIQKPSYWAHVARILQPMARIEVIPDDMSWYAEVMVVATDRASARVAVLRHVDLDAGEAEAIPETHEVKYHGAHKKWSVIRKEDRSVVKDGLQTKEEAIRYLRDHIRTIGA